MDRVMKKVLITALGCCMVLPLYATVMLPKPAMTQTTAKSSAKPVSTGGFALPKPAITNSSILVSKQYSAINVSGNVQVKLVLRGKSIMAPEGQDLSVKTANHILYIKGSDKNSSVIVPTYNSRMITITVNGNAQVDTRAVRADTVFIKTTDNAQARVYARDTVNAVAQGQSRIYYYGKPEHTNIHAYNGAAIVPY